MFNLIKLLCFICVFILSAQGHAVPREPKNFTIFYNEEITGVDDSQLSTSPMSNVISVDGFSAATVAVTLTHDSATTLVLACQQSLDNIAWDAMKKIDTASGSGVATQRDLTISESVSGNTTVIFAPITVSAKFFKCSVSGAGATTSDLVTMKIMLGVL